MGTQFAGGAREEADTAATSQSGAAPTRAVEWQIDPQLRGAVRERAGGHTTPPGWWRKCEQWFSAHGSHLELIVHLALVLAQRDEELQSRLALLVLGQLGNV